jgi:hypothetical protein
MLTAEQVEAAINNSGNPEGTGEDTYLWDADEWYSEISWSGGKAEGEYALNIDGVSYTAEWVEDHGGMDKGSDRWVVFKVGDQLFKKSGFYASHYGTDWDGPLVEVKPVEKTVTVFEKA